MPPYTGHRPPRIRNKEDLPHPFGPTTRTWSPRFMEKDSFRTRILPPGVIMGLRIFSGCNDEV